MITAKQFLQHVHTTLEISEWGQGREAECYAPIPPPKGTICLDMALFQVAKFHNLPEIWSAGIPKDARRAIEQLVPEEFRTCLFRWNDAPGRTKQEVLDLVERAAASL